MDIENFYFELNNKLDGFWALNNVKMANEISNAHLTVFMQAQVELKIGEADSTKWAKLICQALLHLNDRNYGNALEKRS